MTSYKHCERRVWHEFKPRPVVINIKVEDRVSPTFRKTPRTPEYIAMIENIERVEPLPPAFGDIIARMKAQILERYEEQMAQNTMLLLAPTLRPYQREALEALQRGGGYFFKGGKIKL